MKNLTAIMLGASLLGASPVYALINDSKFEESGELFVSIYDSAANKSYYKDLGLSMGPFVANPASQLFDLGSDPSFAEFKGKDNLVYNVAAVYSLLGDASNINSWGYLATSSQGASIFDATFNFVDNTRQKIQSYIGALNPAPFDNSAGLADANLSGVYAPGDLGYHGNGTWGPTMGAGVGGNTEGKVGADVDFYFVNNSTGDDAGKRVEKLGVWNLSSAGILTFTGNGGVTPTPSPSPTASPTPTPVPTALELNAPTEWQVKKAQVITWTPDLSKVKKNKVVTFKFSKDGGPFKSIGKAKYGKGKFKWKPKKSHVTDNGAIQGCVKPSKKEAAICFTVSNVKVSK
jgi:hypothetical protein